jgi:hypothetical protein
MVATATQLCFNGNLGGPSRTARSPPVQDSARTDSTMHKKWRIFSHDAAKVALIERSAGVPPIVAQLLIQRA